MWGTGLSWGAEPANTGWSWGCSPWGSPTLQQVKRAGLGCWSTQQLWHLLKRARGQVLLELQALGGLCGLGGLR